MATKPPTRGAVTWRGAGPTTRHDRAATHGTQEKKGHRRVSARAGKQAHITCGHRPCAAARVHRRSEHIASLVWPQEMDGAPDGYVSTEPADHLPTPNRQPLTPFAICTAKRDTLPGANSMRFRSEGPGRARPRHRAGGRARRRGGSDARGAPPPEGGSRALKAHRSGNIRLVIISAQPNVCMHHPHRKVGHVTMRCARLASDGGGIILLCRLSSTWI